MTYENNKRKWKKQNNKWYFTFTEREIIEKMLNQNISHRKIWKILWRWMSSFTKKLE
jgi:hypothetical protein